MNVDDRQAIVNLISSYSYAFDANDMDEFAALFEKDAVLAYQQSTITGSPLIRQAMTARRQWVDQQAIQPRHYQTNTILTEITEGHVRGRTMLLFTWQRSGEPEPKVVHTGIYEDEFRKVAEGCRFTKRTIFIDHE